MTFPQTWRAFCQQPTTLGPDPGIRQRWHQGRRWYAVWVLRVAEPAVHARMAALAEQLGDAIRPIPASQAHITLFVCGFPSRTPCLDDDIDEATLRAQWRALQSADLSLSLAVGGASSFSTAAFLEVHGDLSEIRGILASCADELRFGPYHPHVTIGTYPQTRPVGPIRAVLERSRDLPLIPIQPAAIELVVFDAHTAGSPLQTRYVAHLPAQPVEE